MPLSYEKAGATIVDLLAEVMAAHHPVLAAHKVKTDVLIVSKRDGGDAELPHALKVHGYPAAASIEVVPLKRRVLKQGDALLVIDNMTWCGLTDDERRACLDHELEHLQVAAEEGGVVEVANADGSMIGVAATDDLGRPKLKLRLHDWQLGGFRAIVARHKAEALEAKAVAACCDEKTGQLYWDWDSVAPVDDTVPLPFPEIPEVKVAVVRRKRAGSGGPHGATPVPHLSSIPC